MRLLFLGEGGVSDAVRCILPMEQFNRTGYFDAIFQALPLGGRVVNLVEDVDVVVYSRPHHLELIKAYKERGAKVIVDMDDDFHTIPKSHPGYPYVGWGNPIGMKNMEMCLEIADLVTVTTNILVDRLQKFNKKPLKIIPNGWSALNELWSVRYEHDTINIGWGGTITHKQDFALCKNRLIEIARQYPNVKIYIGGDYGIYEMLKSVREEQKEFIPMVPYDDYPHLLAYMDIWLAPLQYNDFNLAKSDIKLVDAGVKGIPFIASPLPFYMDWGGGGIIAESSDAWREALTELVTDQELREGYGKEGRKLADEREMSKLFSLWADAVEEVLN